MLYDAIEVMTPFLLAALGGLFTEIAGVLNIALEGLMLTGAFAAFAAASWTGSSFLAYTMAALASCLLAMLFAFVSLRLKANIFIAGLATNLAALGLLPFFSEFLFGSKGILRLEGESMLLKIAPGTEEAIPILGPLLFGHSLLTYFALASVPLTLFILNRTVFGLRLKALGLNEEMLRLRGISKDRYRLIAILISGLACGIAGAQLSLRIGAYVPNISSGRGWIALVAVYLGFKHPYGILAAAFLFGLSETLTGAIQALVDSPGAGTLLWSLPYAITATALIIFTAVRRVKNRT